MIEVVSRDTDHFREPQPVRVVRLLPRHGPWAVEYAWVEVRIRRGPPLTFAMRRRTHRGWQLPEPGREVEALAWRVLDPEQTFAVDPYVPPPNGAIVCYLLGA